MPIITLTTDYGLTDSAVAEMKAVILRDCPTATIVDVTHSLPPRDVLEGALVLARAAKWFPKKTVHLAVVDPTVGTKRASVVCAAHGQFFVGPDNGLLSLAAGDDPVCHRIQFDESSVAPTFHGRDVFAPAAAALARGRLPRQFGTRHRMRRLAITREPCVLRADRFGNLILSVRTVDLPQGTRGVQVHGLKPAPIARTYADVPKGSLVAYGGSAGLIEVAIRDGSAAQELGRPARGMKVKFL